MKLCKDFYHSKNPFFGGKIYKITFLLHIPFPKFQENFEFFLPHWDSDFDIIITFLKQFFYCLYRFSEHVKHLLLNLFWDAHYWGNIRFLKKKLCTFLTPPQKKGKEKGKNFLKSHYKIKKRFSQKQFGKIVLVRLLHLTLTQSRGVLESKTRER